jgi:hypothetical protein
MLLLEIYGKSAGYVRDMFSHHLTLIKSFAAGYFKHIGLDVWVFCSITNSISVFLREIKEKNVEMLVCFEEKQYFCVDKHERKERFHIWLTKEFTCAWRT